MSRKGLRGWLTVLRTPVERIGIDKIRRREGGEPGAGKTDCGSHAEGVGAEALRGDFAAGKPGVRRDHTVVTADINDGHGDNDLSSC